VAQIVILQATNLATPLMNEDGRKQHVAVSVLECESAQTIIVVLEWLKKLDMARREFGCQRVRIGDVKVSVPAGPAFPDVSLVVRQWIRMNTATGVEAEVKPRRIRNFTIRPERSTVDSVHRQPGCVE
jgi:hypothetical protein